MAAERFLPSAPLGPDGPYLAAVLGVLDDIRDMLDDRLPARPDGEPAPSGEPGDDGSAPGEIEAVPVQEPAPRRAPRKPTRKTTGRPS